MPVENYITELFSVTQHEITPNCLWTFWLCLYHRATPNCKVLHSNLIAECMTIELNERLCELRICYEWYATHMYNMIRQPLLEFYNLYRYHFLIMQFLSVWVLLYLFWRNKNQNDASKLYHTPHNLINQLTNRIQMIKFIDKLKNIYTRFSDKKY